MNWRIFKEVARDPKQDEHDSIWTNYIVHVNRKSTIATKTMRCNFAIGYNSVEGRFAQSYDFTSLSKTEFAKDIMDAIKNNSEKGEE